MCAFRGGRVTIEFIIKIFLKKILFLLPFIFINSEANAKFEIEFSNYSEKNIEFIYINLFKNYIAEDTMNLRTTKGIRIFPGESIILENKYNVKFVEVSTSCSWVTIFGKKRTHGWGIALYVNDEPKGTICANKTSILDDVVHARLVYNKDPSDKTFLQFYNTGWWENESVFPIKLSLWLD